MHFHRDPAAPASPAGAQPDRTGGLFGGPVRPHWAKARLALLLVAALALGACADGEGPEGTTEEAEATGAEGSGQGEEDSDEEQGGQEDSEEDQVEPAELPGGGDTLFPDRRFVALYGTPEVPALGALGEQDVDEAITRIDGKAEEYQEYSEEPVQPAFEIITTVATEAPGPDGDHTREIDPETLRPWIEAAEEAGVYVVLDLQPGRTDFLSQAQAYEDLLAAPHVGLALDPEWRIGPGQVHGQQIGSVDAEEINEVSAWLAELTAEHELPQKMLILHQFTDAMITDRANIDTAHEELAITLHADGHGTPGSKMETWERLRQGLPEGIWMAWKNFHRQDRPTFTPEETYEVEPTPWFVSYQ
ncbi:hypothetical protein [Nesterenkonia aerolata]|uniref:Lipoprotein n=1 Tax=Nesterenkonia aerolata TaxID=3074079 RepID=A0ABU2DSL1_9MICC|nr:hypothetical protein [Nesterenkonia sp. LY-0111]MDR8019490.1 hypothetical protein [Nesterenkonia sp. LY-0111]